MKGSVSSQEIIEDLVDDIGIEGSHFRREADRLYLSGIEIATAVAIGIMSSFTAGLFEGVKKSAKKHGEEIGSAAFDKCMSALKTLLEKLRTSGDKAAREAKADFPAAEVDALLTSPQVTRALTTDADAIILESQKTVILFLAGAGYPADIVEARATSMTQTIVRRLNVRKQ